FEFDRLSRFSNRSTIASPLAYDLMKSSLEGLASAFLHFLKNRIVNILLQRHGRPCIYRSRLHQIPYSIMMDQIIYIRRRDATVELGLLLRNDQFSSSPRISISSDALLSRTRANCFRSFVLSSNSRSTYRIGSFISACSNPRSRSAHESHVPQA